MRRRSSRDEEILPDRLDVERVVPADEAAILEAVASLPISTWSYMDDPSVRHLGPMAQDFRAAFGLGEDDVTIDLRDEVNVAIAAIKALYRMVLEQQSALEALSERVTELERLHSEAPGSSASRVARGNRLGREV